MSGTVKCFTSIGLFISHNSVIEVPFLFLFYVCGNRLKRVWKLPAVTEPGRD